VSEARKKIGTAELRRFASYPDYKESNVEGLEEMPAHWEVKKTTWLFTIGSGTTPPDDPMYYGGRIPWITTSELRESIIGTTEETVTERALQDFSSLKMHPEGSVAVAMYGATIGRLGILGIPATVNQACCVFSDPKGIDPLFWFYWLQMRRPHLISLGYGGGQPNLSQALLRSLRVPTPSLMEQRRIVAFLNRETARIDALVAQKERLIQQLQEKRNAIIARAICADPNVKKVRLGYYVDLLAGYAFPSSEFSHDPDDIRLLRGVNVSTGVTRWNDVVYWPRTDIDHFRGYQLREEDIVFGMDRPWVGGGIRVAEIGKRDLPALLLQRVARMRAKKGLAQGYLKLILASPQFLAYFEPILTGISVPHVSPEQILAFRVRLPEVHVQDATCFDVRAKTERIDSMRNVLHASIDRLKVLRATLISAAVTGKIDVRGEAA
jgi:type I restriction enzyme S subunit